MQFCSNCGTRLRYSKIEQDAATHLTCPKCGNTVTSSFGSIATQSDSTNIGMSSQIKVLEEKGVYVKTMPTVALDCPKCSGKEAYWWFLQTRSGDEPPTQFYRCTSCNHTWRSYS